MDPKKLIIVIDMQNDFVDGALGFAKAEDVVSAIRHHLESNQTADVFFTRDTHHKNYPETLEGQNIAPHCLENTAGWQIVSALKPFIKDKIFDKPTFGSLELANYLAQHGKGYDVIELVGLVSNICVISNAVLIRAALPDTRIRIFRSMTASYDERLHDQALDVLAGMFFEIE